MGSSRGKSGVAATVGAALLLLSPLSLPGCDPGGSRGSGSRSRVTNASGALLVGGAPTDELSAFMVTVTGLFLTDESGVESSNLLGSAHTVDLQALGTRSALLEVRPIPPGRYVAARLAFDPLSIVARDPFGARVVIATTSSGVADDLSATFVATTGEERPLHLEVPLDTTLADDLANPGRMIWSPTLFASDRSGSPQPLQEFDGRIVSRNPSRREIGALLFDRETGADRGRVTVRLSDTTQFLGDDGDAFVSEAHFLAFVRDDDRLEIAGTLATDGRVDARVVQVERDSVGGAAIARIRGPIVALDLAADQLTLRLRTVDFGRAFVEPLLLAMGEPREIVIGYAGAGIEVRGADARQGDENDLAIGMEAKIDFTAFSNEPFAAREVEGDDDDIAFSGKLVDDAGLPGVVMVHLDPHDPAVASGLVASPTTDVDLLLDGIATFTLALEGTPALPSTRLAEGLRVDARGDLTGPPDEPTIDATSLSVRPGKLRGVVTAVDSSLRTFVVDVAAIDRAFGGAALPDPVTIRFDAAALVRGDAPTIDAFFALFQGLGAGATLAVSVDGLADGAGGAETWRVEAEVDD